MADLDDEVGEDLVEDAEGFGVGVRDGVGRAAGRGWGAEAVEKVLDWFGGCGLEIVYGFPYGWKEKMDVWVMLTIFREIELAFMAGGAGSGFHFERKALVGGYEQEVRDLNWRG